MSERGSRLLRRLDEWAGIPLAVTIGALSPQSKRPDRVDRIGILMLGVIGDTLLASAIFEDLRRSFPEATIIAFISQGNRGVIDLLNGVGEVVHIAVKHPLAAARILRSSDLDVLIDIGQWARISALLSRFSGARYTIGFKTAGQFRHQLFDATETHSNQRHEIDNFRALLRPLGITGTALPTLRDDVRQEARAQGKTNMIILHPWAAGYLSHLREWPEERWVALAARLHQDGFRIAITGGPDDRPRAESLASKISGVEIDILAGKTSLRETAIHLARSACVISVNTGIMHLAAIVGAPLVGLHGPTNPLRWGPINQNAAILGPGPEEGGAFLNLGFEYPPNPPDCMGKIAVEDVLREYRDVMAQQRDPRFALCN